MARHRGPRAAEAAGRGPTGGDAGRAGRPPGTGAGGREPGGRTGSLEGAAPGRIYEQGRRPDRALVERRRAALLSTADGEDWFDLAQTEARLGNTASAQRAYAQALRAPGTPLSPAHRTVARQNLP